jgi:ubiquinone biosynthesis protein Coq4
MPVPFPTATEVNLERPDAAEARTIAGGVAGAVAVDGKLTSLQRLMIEAITESMTGWVLPATRVPRLGPDAMARALAARDELFRSRMIQFMLLCALVLDPIPEAVVERIDEYSAELGVSSEVTRIARHLARGSFGLALVDFARSGYMETWDPTQSTALHTSRELNVAWEECVQDAALAARWDELRALPQETLGKQVADFYEARGFVCPGRPGSAPPLLAQHDWVHVLAGYGSTVESEIEVFAFIARANDDPRAFSLLAQVVCLFETGYAATGLGLFEYDRGHLSHEGMAVRLADAMRRGALCAAGSSGIDLLGLDWFEHADQPLDEVRARLHVEPKDARAVDAGSVTPWEAGGISVYQLNAGHYAASVSGHDYDAHGASAPSEHTPG